jgi:SAM-dependent methyltransferase
MDPYTYWQNLEDKKNYIRGYGEGVGTLSRDWLLTVIKDGESLLDVGCGPGCTYENLSGRDIRYRGLDFAPGFVDACRELFPDGNFQVGDAMNLDEPDGSWDTVLLRHVLEHTPHYREPIAEALRVARRRVVIVMWRPLGVEDDIRIPDRGESNDYGASDFMAYLHSFVLPLSAHEFGGDRPNWAWVLYKALDECVFDLDDYHDDAPHLGLLVNLKRKYPALKVTLFAVPGRSSTATLDAVANLDWVELAVHGWTHEPNTECKEWRREDAARYLDAAEEMGFVKGFRPPGWQISDAALDELAARGYWIAPHWRDRGRVAERGMRVFYAHHNHQSVHGHFQDIPSNNPRLRNGLRQLVEERGLPWDGATRFRFVSEALT